MSLAMVLMGHRFLAGPALFTILLGCFGHASMKTAVMLGEHEHLPAALAAWITPAFLLAICVVVLAASVPRARLHAAPS
jgi:hypothetical protein